MMQRPVRFYSDGIKLEGFLLTPEGARADEPRPTILINSGMFGLKEWVPARFWPQFLDAGFACMAFDYRGFGTSDGQRGRIFPEEEVRDVMNAVTFLAEQPEVDASAIGTLGWGLGGGIVVSAAARDPRIAAVATVNGPGDVGRATRDTLPYMAWLSLQDRLATDRVHRVLTGESNRIAYQEIVHPDGTFEHTRNEQFRKDMSELGEQPSAEFTLESAEAYYSFKPELEVASISPRPVLVVHGTRNHYMPIDEAHHVYERANEPKSLIEIEGAEHLEWIDIDSPLHRPNVDKIVQWFGSVMGVAPTSASPQ
jgi:dipeptidyl aminopeptidase/acylaminoacyl peptidase